ncbi:MAG: flagellar hook-associated protein FlgK [Desulfuromonas thiophila]|jgi:flagellar hook-associated protein 1 FlgK|nr:flagellar hook-associated protein FlgK [Desulfuromonas thiophila]MDY0399023.1 flagellar hook-associated protein FlgK [Desulfuromonas thiophila]
MAGLISALYIGQTGLMVSQKGLEVTGNNVTNAGTEGYSRQTLEVSAAPSLEYNGTMVGLGATVSGIGRQGAAFVSSQLVSKSAAYGEQDAMAEPLAEIERILSVTDTSLAGEIDAFFEAWQSLSTDPASTVVRQQVLQAGDALADQFNQMEQELGQVEESINIGIEGEIGGLNQQLEQLADLNVRILSTEASGQTANGLRDERDLLVQQISETIGIQTYESSNGMISAQLTSGLTLVEGGSANLLGAQRVDGAVLLSLDMGSAQASLGLEDLGGRIGGLMSVRDGTIQTVRSQLDQLAYGLATQVNTVHGGGLDAEGNSGSDFFTVVGPTDPAAELWSGAAASLSLALTSGSQLAAGASSATGDNTNVLALVALQNENLIDGSTLNEFYSRVAAQLGLAVEQNSYDLETSEDALVQAQSLRDALAGVSVDEEVLLMTQYQSGYEAAAKYVSVVAEMLDILMGIGD